MLLHGVHYHCSQSTMAQIVRNNASMRGVRVRLIDTGTEIVVEVTRRRKTDEIPHTNRTPISS